jgi:beta-lactamase class A
MFACKDVNGNSKEFLKQEIAKSLEDINGKTALAFIDLSDPKDTLFFNVDEKFHAASTMKVPIMIELFKQSREKRFRLTDSILVINNFKSFVDGSPYSLDIKDDSDDIIYGKIGSLMTIHDLMYSMITVSSNLATNILIELVDAGKVSSTMKDLGANSIEVLRGVEDKKAYDIGLSNSTTARDLMLILKAISTNKAGSEEDCKSMIEILKDQTFDDMIPLYLPQGTPVAHKTGTITGVHHDMAIVNLQDGRSYILVLLSKELGDFERGTDRLAKLSLSIYNYMVHKKYLN